MTPTSDVVIAGAGIIGLASAWYLRAAGVHVTVLEAGAAGRQASWAGGGILWPIYPWRYPEAVRALAERGAALYPDWCRQLTELSGIDPQCGRTGALILDADERAAAIDWACASGWKYESLSAQQLAERLPMVAAGEGGVLLPEVRQVRNPRLCRALVSALKARGVAVLQHTPVRAIELRNGRFAGFRTDGGVIGGGAGVIAAGAWSGCLADYPELAGIHPVKGQMLLLAGRPGQLAHILVRRARYAIPRVDGRILVGSTLEDAGFDRVPTDAAKRELIAAAAAMSAELADLPVEAHWAGLRPATRDAKPVIGAVDSVPGLFANLGHFRNGLVNAPAAAQQLMAAVLGAAGARL